MYTILDNNKSTINWHQHRGHMYYKTVITFPAYTKGICCEGIPRKVNKLVHNIIIKVNCLLTNNN